MDTRPEGPIELPLRGSGNQTRAFIHIDDFIRGLLLAYDKGEHMNVYHVGSMEELRIGEVAATIAEVLGVRIALRPGPAPVGEAERRCPDTSKLQALGFGGPQPFREGVRDVVKWYVTHRDLWPPPPPEGMV
jgi:dTDP-glucose 4,6-dehydratase/UDP-glucose 4-epimerase